MRQKQHGRAYTFEWGAIQKFQKLKVSQNLEKYECLFNCTNRHKKLNGLAKICTLTELINLLFIIFGRLKLLLLVCQNGINFLEYLSRFTI